MSHYEHTDAKSTLIGATVKKIHLPIDLLYMWKSKLQASFILTIENNINWIKSNLDLNYKTKTSHILFMKSSCMIIIQIRS